MQGASGPIMVGLMEIIRNRVQGKRQKGKPKQTGNPDGPDPRDDNYNDPEEPEEPTGTEYPTEPEPEEPEGSGTPTWERVLWAGAAAAVAVGAVALVAATIAEDFATAGVGVADDPASFTAAGVSMNWAVRTFATACGI